MYKVDGYTTGSNTREDNQQKHKHIRELQYIQ
jgi:hypothetical protein